MMSQDNRLLPLPAGDRALERPLSDLAQSKPYGTTAIEASHLRDYLYVVLKRKWLILTLVLVVTSLVAIQMYRLPSIYEASATLQIEQKPENVLKTKEIVINTGNVKDPAYVNTQLRLLENPALARQVILTLDLQHNPAFLNNQSQASFFASLRKIFTRDKTPATASPAVGSNEQIVTVEQVKGDNLSPEELAKLEPYEDMLSANLTVEPIVATNLVTLHYQHTDPELAQKIVNTLGEVFVYNNYEREHLGGQESKEILAQKIAELQLKIKQAEETQLNFAKSNNVQLPDQPGGNLPQERLLKLNSQLLDAENETKSARSLYESAKTTDPNDIPEVQDNKRVQALREKLEDLRQKRAELLVIYTPDWPAVKQIDEQIKPLEDALAKAPREVLAAMKARYESAARKENELRAEFNQAKGETSAQNLAQIQMGSLKQETETNKQYLNTLLQRLHELEGTGDQTLPNNVSISQYSRLPRTPVGPPRVRNILLALLLSLGTGIGLAFLLDYLDDTLKSVEDVDRYIHLPALALIPSNRFTDRLRLKARGASAHVEGSNDVTALALIDDARSPIAEAYRHLRTSLLLSTAGQPPKTILVTSSQPSEGKTTTAVNTAVMLAQTGAEVLIIDCDLRRPRLHSHFNVPNAGGVTNYLSGESDLDGLIQAYEKLPNLKLLTSGPVPPNPAELLGSDEMRKLVNMLGKRFTHIIIDSPPAISFTDASVLSTLVDGVMLVVHGGKSWRAVVRRAKQQLLDVGAHIFGIVLNNVKLEPTDYYYASYYSNYYGPDDGAPDDGVGAGEAR